MLSPRVAVGIADRLSEARDPETLRRKGLLDSCIVLVFVLHMLGMLGLIRMQEWEATCVRVIRDVGVQFELTPPPVNEILAVGMVPPPVLVEGDPVPRSAPATPRTVPEFRSPKESSIAEPVVSTAGGQAARRVARTTPAAPIAVMPVNAIKAPIVGAPDNGQLAMAPLATIAAGGILGSEDDRGGAAESNRLPGGNNGAAPEITRFLQPGDRGINIAPYRKEMLRRIALKWNPAGTLGNLTVQLTIAKDGTLIGVELVQSSGRKRLDRQVLDVIRSTEFAPLPQAYRGESLMFKIDFASVKAVEN